MKIYGQLGRIIYENYQQYKTWYSLKTYMRIEKRVLLNEVNSKRL